MTDYLLTENGRIAYDVTGPADGILWILAPGIGDLRAEHRFLAPRLVAARQRVALMDLRGHGESSSGWAEYTPHAVGRDMLALAAQLNAPRFVLGGCSMAAASAVWAAVESPEQVAGLVLLGPALVDAKLAWSQKLALQVGFSGPWRVRAWESYLASLFPERKPDDLAAYRKQLRANLAEPGRFAAVSAMLNASKAACSERMATVQAPTLLVMGEKDPDYADPAAIAAAWGKELRAQVAVVPGAGHYPHVDSPEATIGLISDWLRESQMAIS